jgi:hypothetical protein
MTGARWRVRQAWTARLGENDRMVASKAPSLTRKRPPFGFVVLVYRMPVKPTAGRVAVWRQLKKIGAIYLQQSVCIFPNTTIVRKELDPLLSRIETSGGQFHLLPLNKLSAVEEKKLIVEFLSQTSRHYAEIIENCEVNFHKEIQFETFRKNFTYEEAEEIRVEYEKICSWFDRVRERDWFGAPKKAEAASWIRRSRLALEAFEAQVYKRQSGTSLGSDADRRKPAKLLARRRITSA